MTKFLQSPSRQILRKAVRDLRGWKVLGKIEPYLIFDGVKFVRLEFQISITKLNAGKGGRE